HRVARPGRDAARQRMGRRQPRKTGEALSAAPAPPARRRGADGRAARFAAQRLDHRPGAQHQRRLQHGLRVAMLHTDLIAPIPDLLRRHAAARGDKVAYRDAQTSVTYAGLLGGPEKRARHTADHGIAPSDTVAIMLPNSVPWVESCF